MPAAPLLQSEWRSIDARHSKRCCGEAMRVEPQGKVHLITARRLFIAAAESKARSTGVVDGSALQSRLFTHSAGSVGCTSTSRATAAELSAPQQINLRS